MPVRIIAVLLQADRDDAKERRRALDSHMRNKHVRKCIDLGGLVRD